MPRGVRLLDLRSVCSSSGFYGLRLNSPQGEGTVLQAYKTLEQHWRRATNCRNAELLRKDRGFKAYVLNKNGKPLTSAKRHGKARHLLEDGKAKAARIPY
jgi:hypothetical protein